MDSKIPYRSEKLSGSGGTMYRIVEARTVGLNIKQFVD